MHSKVLFLIFFSFIFEVFGANEYFFRFRKGTGKIFSEGNTVGSDPIPRGRCSHSLWTESTNVYVFGGITNMADDRMSVFSLNDLWKYETDSNAWTKLGGCDMSESEQNAQGEYTSPFYPGARYGSIAYSVGSSFYLYGGKGYTESSTKRVLADLWKYDYTNNSWDIVLDERDDGVESSKSDTIHPGAKYMSTVWNLDDIVYIFGGSGYSSSIYGFMNDMWKVENGETFSFEAGSTTPFGGGTFTTSNAMPPALFGAKGWAYDSKLYLFGGRGLKSGGSTPNPSDDDLNYFNNLFVYDPSTKLWGFLGGDQNDENSRGDGEDLYSSEDLGPKNVPLTSSALSYSSDNWPGARSFFINWKNNGVLYLTGGIGQETLPDSCVISRAYSNVWMYDVNENQWKVHSNWNLPDGEGGQYTAVDSFASTNFPGHRHLAAHAIVDQSLYIFFGWGADTENTKYGAYYDTLMASTDEVWELKLDLEDPDDSDDTIKFDCYGEEPGSGNECSGQGECVDSNDCQCYEGYTGNECEHEIIEGVYCYGVASEESDVCSGNGRCVNTDDCECFSGYIGDICNISLICFNISSDDENVCSGNGDCVEEDECNCFTGYEDEECSTVITCDGIRFDDEDVCGGEGECVNTDRCTNGSDQGYQGWVVFLGIGLGVVGLIILAIIIITITSIIVCVIMSVIKKRKNDDSENEFEMTQK